MSREVDPRRVVDGLRVPLPGSRDADSRMLDAGSRERDRADCEGQYAILAAPRLEDVMTKNAEQRRQDAMLTPRALQERWDRQIEILTEQIDQLDGDIDTL